MEILKGGKRIDLVISDVVMPGGMSGFGLAEWIRTEMPRLKILLISGNFGAKSEMDSNSEVPVMGKPYTMTELSEKIRDVMGLN